MTAFVGAASSRDQVHHAFHFFESFELFQAAYNKGCVMG